MKKIIGVGLIFFGLIILIVVNFSNFSKKYEFSYIFNILAPFLLILGTNLIRKKNEKNKHV